MSTRDWSPLEEVAIAVSVATEHENELYLERRGDRYRWSLVHRGGPYPLVDVPPSGVVPGFHHREVATG